LLQKRPAVPDQSQPLWTSSAAKGSGTDNKQQSCQCSRDNVLGTMITVGNVVEYPLIQKNRSAELRDIIQTVTFEAVLANVTKLNHPEEEPRRSPLWRFHSAESAPDKTGCLEPLARLDHQADHLLKCFSEQQDSNGIHRYSVVSFLPIELRLY
jgi:hypothetical protein